MSKVLVYIFIIAVGLFVFNQKNPAKFEQMVTTPFYDLQAAITNFSYEKKKKEIYKKKEILSQRYNDFSSEYEREIEKLEKEKAVFSGIVNPNMSLEENLSKINEKISQKKEEFLDKKDEIEKQINDLEKRYDEIKKSIERFQESVKKIKEGINQGQDSVNDFTNAINP